MSRQSQTRYDYESLVRRTVLQEITLAAHAAHMPQGFIDGITFRRISDTEFEIENAWSKDDEYGHHPLAVYHEFGTDDHWVAPVKASALAWQSAGPQSGRPRAIYSKRHDNKRGDTLFSKGHYVSGLPPLEPMTRGFKIGMERMRTEVNHA